MSKKIKRTVGIVAGIMILLFLTGYIYSTFFKPAYTGSQNVTGLLIFGFLAGIVLAYLIFQLRNRQNRESGIVTGSHTVVESMRRVFKVVVAEGQLNEIYNYENTKKLLKFIPSTKKALVIVRAKVLIGYDFEKCQWETDEVNKKIRIVFFPKPEILSLDPDFNYYYFEDDLFNFIGRKDLQQIQELAREQVEKAALSSNLMKIAADQMKVLLNEVFNVNHWNIENIDKIDDYKYISDQEEENTREHPKLTKKESPFA